MYEVVGDLFRRHEDYICICTNATLKYPDRLVMGCGTAKQALKKYPGLDDKLGGYIIRFGNRVFVCKKERIISFPTKYHWKDPSNLTLIRRSTEQLVQVCDKFKIRSVALPWPGAGAGGLQYHRDVRPILQEYLDNRFTVVEYAYDRYIPRERG